MYAGQGEGWFCKRCFGLLRRKREKREKEEGEKKRKRRNQQKACQCTREKKEKKDHVKEGTWEGVAEKRTDGLSRQLMC